MKGLIRHTVVNGVSLAILDQVIPGVTIIGGFVTYIIAGFVLSLLLLILKPILSIFSLPLNMLTLGLFSFFTNAIILYVLTIFVTQITISKFTFEGFTFAGFVVPVMHFGTFWAFVLTAAILSLIIGFFDWLLKSK
jgi:putative membrane protein